MLATTLLTFAGLVSISTAGYVLEDDYTPSSFFSMFDFYTASDPTSGYVQYVDQGTAQSGGLINTNSGIYIGVDHTNVASGAGRQSVRLTSTKTYNHGLIVLDLQHMPGGICGTWPAFWTVGTDWPSNGEIDIIEGVNSQTQNEMTLHTADGCQITNNGAFSGVISTSNCAVDASNQAANAGCQIGSSQAASFGAGFNANGGGVYAMEWTSSAINVWFFERGSIPGDATGSNPNPAGWGVPSAQFQGGCNIDNFIKNQQIVFDTTFCGDWAGNVWSTDSTCSAKASTCQDYVQNNPSAFADAYWQINSLKVYQAGSANAPASSASSASPSSSTSSSSNTSTKSPTPTSSQTTSSSTASPTTTTQSTTLLTTTTKITFSLNTSVGPSTTVTSTITSTTAMTLTRTATKPVVTTIVVAAGLEYGQFAGASATQTQGIGTPIQVGELAWASKASHT